MTDQLPPNKVSAAWIASTREKYGLTKVEAARMCCVTTATWNRWETGKYPMNPCTFQHWLSVLEQRIIPRSGLAGKRWSGWYFRDGKLITPLGDEMTAAQIESQQQQIQQTRSVYRNAQKVREHAKSGLSEAGSAWHGWKFEGGYIINPDGRKISATELNMMMVGYDAMMMAKNTCRPEKSYNTDVVQLKAK